MASPIEKYWHGTSYFDCERLNITIVHPTTSPGETWAKAVVVHLLTREENQGNHNEYFDAIDQDNKQLRGSVILGKNNNINLRTVIDKPPDEFGSNFSVFAQDTMDAWLDEVPGVGKVKSDRVNSFSTRWGGPIVGGQDYGHISIYVIWQLVTGDIPVPPDPLPDDCAKLLAAYEASLLEKADYLHRLQTIEGIAKV